MSEVQIKKLANGLTMIAEPMADVSSGSFSIRLPAGTARENIGLNGLSSIMTDLVFRGTEEMDSRTLSAKLDSLGLHYNSGSSNLYSSFSGALVADKLGEALKLHADVFMRARLEEEQFELCRESALQHLDSLEDDPRQKISMLAFENFMMVPYGKPSVGKEKEIQAISHEDALNFYKRFYNPNGAIIAVAGAIEAEATFAMIEENFGSWQGEKLDVLPKAKYQCLNSHQHKDGAQIHIAMIYPSVNIHHEDYYKAKAAVAILSGGMGSRLFTEVREKRGLCYSVGASHTMIADQGLIMGYVGSSPDKAQEALDVMKNEFVNLANGISEDELDRAKIGLRASLIMQGESSGARAGGCAGDYALLGRVRSLEEIEKAILDLSVDDVVGFAKANQPEEFTITTIGAKELI
ncbi:MAG: insulinase family protein [Phycisphaerae bacterium]|nr:insulinase family protein [Phycisphaerae bacterium]